MFEYIKGIFSGDSFPVKQMPTEQKTEKNEVEAKTDEISQILSEEGEKTDDLSKFKDIENQKKEVLQNLEDIRGFDIKNRDPSKIKEYYENEYRKLPLELQHDKEILSTLFNAYVSNRNVTRTDQYIENIESFISGLPESVKKDPELMRYLLLKGIGVFKMIETLDLSVQEKLYGDPIFLLEILRFNGSSAEEILKKLPDKLKNDDVFLKKLAAINWNFKKYLLPKMNEAELRDFLLNYNVSQPFNILNSCEQSLQDKLYKDEELVLSLLQKTEEDPNKYTGKISPSVLYSKTFLQKAILVEPSFIRGLPEEQQKNPKIILDIFEKSKDRARFVLLCPPLHDSLTMNIDFIREGIKIDPRFVRLFNKSTYSKEELRKIYLDFAQVNGGVILHLSGMELEAEEFIMSLVDDLNDKNLQQLINEVQQLNSGDLRIRPEYDKILKVLTLKSADRKMKSMTREKGDLFYKH